MKKLILILILGICFTQTYEDVVILKNGSEIHGIIIEQKPNEYIKIQSGQNVFVFQMDEIEVMKKEIISNEDFSNDKSESNIFDKNHSIGIGFLTNKNYNIFQKKLLYKSAWEGVGIPFLYIYFTTCLSRSYSFARRS